MRQFINIINEGNDSSIESQVAKIAKQFGVSMDIDVYDDSIVLLNIDRDDGGKPGSGAQAIRALCAIADQQHLPISLTAAEGHPRLISYYLEFGFQIVGVSHKQLKRWLAKHERQWEKDHANDEDLEGVMMVRQPHSSP